MTQPCANCGADLPGGARFCPACGTPAPVAEPVPSRPVGAEPAPSRQVAGERKPVTALFADVVGSVTLAERMDPEDWSALMSTSLAEIERAVRRYDGSIAKLLGDGVLALFGAETAHEDDPERAARAAVEILAAFDRMRAAGGLTAAPDLAIRIGINTGLALVGTVSSGDGDRADMSAYGDTVNVAARLQSAAAPGTALLAASTYRLASHAVEARDLGEMDLRGRSEAVHAFQLVGLRAAPASRRGVEGLRSPMVGRDAEIALLERRVAELRGGRGAGAVLIGEPGIGKSRLLAELRGRIETSGTAQWVEGRARSYGRVQADHLLGDLVRSLDRVAAEDAARHRVLQSLVGGDGRAVDTSPESVRAAYVEAIGGLLRSCAGRGPVVAVVDDLHWSDESSAETIAALLPAAAAQPVLLIASTRDERDVPGWRLVEEMRREFGSFDELAIRPLSEHDARTLVANLLDIDALPDPVRERIVARADGNPFFVEETIRMLIDRGALAFRDGRCVATEEITRVDIPETIHGLLLARIDRLPPDPRRALRVASVIGREFSSSLLAEVLAAVGEPLPPPALAAALTDLQAAGLVRVVPGSDPPVQRFRHALVQEAAYDSLLRTERATLHGAVGAALERGAGDAPDELAARISEHFDLAGAADRALPWARRAAEAASARYALPEAVAQFRRAIALATELRRPASELTELYLRAGRSIELMDRYAEAVALYEEMLAVARSLGDRPMELAGLAARATGEAIGVASTASQTETETLARQGLALARELGDARTESKLLWTLLLANRFAWGDLEAGIEYGRRSIAVAREAGFDEQVALSAQDLAASLAVQGGLAEALALLGESIAYWQRTGNLPFVANGLRNRGEIEWLTGHLATARRTYEEALATDERTANVWGRGISRLGLGCILADQGELEAGIALLEEALAIAAPSGLTVLELSTSASLAGLLVGAGQLERARALVAAAADAAVKMPFVADVPRAIQAAIELRAGRPQAAHALAPPGTGYIEAQPFAFTIAPLWAPGIEAAIAVGRADLATPALRRILERAGTAGARLWEPPARRLHALAMLADGDVAGAEAELRRALDIARDIGLVPEIDAIERARTDLAARGAGEAR